jgi:hypothetical protein
MLSKTMIAQAAGGLRYHGFIFSHLITSQITPRVRERLF